MPGITSKATFIKFLEYLYCDRFVEEVTGV